MNTRQTERQSRVGDLMLGCVVGIAVAWLLSKLWPLAEPHAVHPATK